MSRKFIKPKWFHLCSDRKFSSLLVCFYVQNYWNFLMPYSPTFFSISEVLQGQNWKKIYYIIPSSYTICNYKKVLKLISLILFPNILSFFPSYPSTFFSIWEILQGQKWKKIYYIMLSPYTCYSFLFFTQREDKRWDTR